MMKCVLTLLCSLVALSSCCSGAVPCDADAPAVSRAELTALVDSRSAVVLRLHDDVRGGTGLTRGTAWQLMRKDMSAVSQEYLILRLLGLGRGESQTLVRETGRCYDVHHFSCLAEDGSTTELPLRFDITAYYRHSYGRNALEQLGVLEGCACLWLIVNG